MLLYCFKLRFSESIIDPSSPYPHFSTSVREPDTINFHFSLPSFWFSPSLSFCFLLYNECYSFFLPKKKNLILSRLILPFFILVDKSVIMWNCSPGIFISSKLVLLCISNGYRKQASKTKRKWAEVILCMHVFSNCLQIWTKAWGFRMPGLQIAKLYCNKRIVHRD